jgi:hypothetical protein
MHYKKQLNNFQEKMFTIFIYISYILLFISAFGLSKTAPEFLSKINYYASIYICLFLIWRFNPFRTHYEFTDLDRKIAFSAGLFIFTTTILNKYLNDTKDVIKHLVFPSQL